MGESHSGTFHALQWVDVYLSPPDSKWAQAIKLAISFCVR